MLNEFVNILVQQCKQEMVDDKRAEMHGDTNGIWRYIFELIYITNTQLISRVSYFFMSNIPGCKEQSGLKQFERMFDMVWLWYCCS